MKKILSLLPIVFLTACGGSGSDDSSSVGTGVSPAVAISASDTLNDINMSTETVTNMGVIDLSRKVVSSDGSALKLTKVEPLNSSTEARCQINQVNDLNFEVKADNIGSCFYTYTVATEDGSATSSATSAISVQDVSGGANLTLPTITKSVGDINTPLTIDYVTELGVDYPTGSELDESALVVQGNGTVNYDAVNDKLIFTGTDEGISRIYYTLNDYSNMVSYIGVIEVVASDSTAVSATLEVTNMTVTGSPGIVSGQTVTIDVADSVTSNLYQDYIQLLDVSSFTADVALSSTTDLNNTKFTFEAPNFGSHTVTYTVTDQHGNYNIAVAVVEVEKDSGDVGEIIKLDWAAITIEDSTISDDITFLAPPSKSIADYMTDPYISTYSETGDLGPIAAVVPEMDYYQAQAYCKKYDARLPLVREFELLYNSVPTVGVGEIYKEHNWPTTQDFWTAEQTSVSRQTSTYNLGSGTVGSADMDTDTAYVTCVALTGSVKDYSIKSVNQIPTQGTKSEFSLAVYDPDGNVAANKEVLLSTEFTRGGFRLSDADSLSDELYVSADSGGVINFDYLDTSLNDEVVLIDVSSSREKETYISSVFDKIDILVTDKTKWNRYNYGTQGGDIGDSGIPLFCSYSCRTSNVYKEDMIGKDWLAYYVTYTTNTNIGKGRVEFFIQQRSNNPNDESGDFEKEDWVEEHNNPVLQIDDIFAVMVNMYDQTTTIQFGYGDTDYIESTPEVRVQRIYQWFEKRDDTLYYYYSETAIRPAEPKYTVPFTWPGIDPSEAYWIGFSSSTNYEREAYIMNAGFTAY